jgi:hypothetical protein
VLRRSRLRIGKKPRKTAVRIADYPAEIRTRHIPNESLHQPVRFVGVNEFICRLFNDVAGQSISQMLG